MKKAITTIDILPECSIMVQCKTVRTHLDQLFL